MLSSISNNEPCVTLLGIIFITSLAHVLRALLRITGKLACVDSFNIRRLSLTPGAISSISIRNL